MQSAWCRGVQNCYMKKYQCFYSVLIKLRFFAPSFRQRELLRTLHKVICKEVYWIVRPIAIVLCVAPRKHGLQFPFYWFSYLGSFLSWSWTTWEILECLISPDVWSTSANPQVSGGTSFSTNSSEENTPQAIHLILESDTKIRQDSSKTTIKLVAKGCKFSYREKYQENSFAH